MSAGGRYFIAVTLDRHERSPRYDATVWDAFTGEVTASLLRWAGDRLTSVGGVSAAGPPGTFVLTAAPRDPGDSRVYRLRVGGDGAIAWLEELPWPTGVDEWTESSVLGRSAVSPDGRKLVCTVPERLGYSPSNPPPPGARVTPFTELVTIMLDTGELTRRTSRRPGVIDSLSWDAAGRLLSYMFRFGNGNTIRVVDTETASDWVTGSRVVAAGTGEHGDYLWPVLSPSGDVVYVIAARSGPPGSKLLSLPVAGGPPQLLAGDPTDSWTQICCQRTGQYLLLLGRGYLQRASLPTGELARIPFQASPVLRAAW